MTNEEKAVRFDYVTYELEGLLKADILDIEEGWTKNPALAYHRARLNAYRDTLYSMTKEDKWLLSLEELAEVFNAEEEEEKKKYRV